MKWKLLLPLFLAFGKSIAEQLREQDDNTTGLDDEAADAIDYAIDRIQKFLASKQK